MAQLGNLIVTGSSRFLNDIKCQGVQTPFQNGGFMCGDASAATDFTVILQGVIATSANNNTIAIMPNSQDITNTGTWNGTNTSLKTAVTNARSTVLQTPSDTNANYEILFSHSANNTSETNSVSKSNGFIYNPNKQNCLIGSLKGNTPLGKNATAFGYMVEATGDDSHAEGAGTTASGGCSHTEGVSTTASGDYSHAEGNHTTANHASQHVFGEYNIADDSTAAATERGNYVEIVGNGTGSSAKSNARTLDWSGNEWLQRSLTIGYRGSTSTYGVCSLAVGSGHTCSGHDSVAEGDHNTVTGNYSHVEGTHNTVDTDYGHAEGQYTTASGYYSHVEGDHTIANHNSQHVFGTYNIADPSTTSGAGKGTYIEIVGNGTSSTRANARTLNWSGNEWIAGTLTQGSSIEIKKNVADMTQEDGDKILNLRPVVFDYKSSEKDVQAERGFIAEEVAEIIPNLVTDKIVNDKGETVAPASLNYIAMIPYLVKVFQRQQKEIDELKSLIGK